MLEKEDVGVGGSSSVARSRLLTGARSRIHGFSRLWYSGWCFSVSLSSQSSKLAFLRMWGERRMEEREEMLDWRQELLKLARRWSRMFPSPLLIDRTLDIVFMMAKIPHDASLSRRLT